MVKKILIILCAVILLAGCGGKKGPMSRSDQEIDIQEALFRYQFTHNYSSIGQKANVYFLALGTRTDPSQELLYRFKGHTPMVKAASATSHLGFGGVTDRSSGKLGIIFRVGNIQWVQDGDVVVEGGWHESQESHYQTKYRMKLQDGAWTVVEEGVDYIE